jgi:hypothetical protein
MYEILDILNISRKKLQNILDSKGLKVKYQLFKELNFEGSLRNTLIWKYKSFAKRCQGLWLDRNHQNYKGLDYMDLEDWVQFCNDNKQKLEAMWKKYIESGKQLKYAISIDRIDNSKGYVIGNVQFVIHGYNSWKNNVRPVEITHKCKTRYFMSCEEASKHYGLNKRTMGNILRQDKYCPKNYIVKLSTKEKVLQSNDVNSMFEYYKTKIM